MSFYATDRSTFESPVEYTYAATIFVSFDAADKSAHNPTITPTFRKSESTTFNSTQQTSLNATYFASFETTNDMSFDAADNTTELSSVSPTHNPAVDAAKHSAE